MLKKSRKQYKKGKYFTRKKIHSFKNKESQHIKNVRKIYKLDKVVPSKELAKKTGCVRPQVKQTVFKTRDANSAINIMNLTKCWIDRQERPVCFQISSFTTSNTKEEVEKVRPS